MQEQWESRSKEGCLDGCLKETWLNPQPEIGGSSRGVWGQLS